MWISIATGVNNFFSGESMGRAKKGFKDLKSAFLSLLQKAQNICIYLQINSKFLLISV
jgi:phage-related protein